MSNLGYQKRRGTSGATGQLYETKLTSLILFRLLYDDEIEDCFIGTNVDKMGEFDDICFKYTTKHHAKPVVVFLQAKHKEDRNIAIRFTKSDLRKYFNSYLNIRNKFNANSTDAIFGGTYNDVECAFVFYTNAALNLDNVERKLYDIQINGENKMLSTIDKIISTGVDVAKLSYDASDRLFEDIVLHEKIKNLATLLANVVVTNGENYKSLMNNELIQMYHVILSQKVFHVSDMKPDSSGQNYRLGYFEKGDDFFRTTDEHLLLLKDSLLSEVLKYNKFTDEEINLHLSALFLKSESHIISRLIGHVIEYKNNKLEFLSEKLNSDAHLKQQLDRVSVTESVVAEAVEIAGKSKLCSVKFKLPAAFGNSDMTLMGNDLKKQKRLNYLAMKVVELLKKSEESNFDVDVSCKEKYIVKIDENFPNKGIIKANGGIASAVGNLLVLEEKTKLLMFNNADNLSGHAKTLFTTIHSNVKDMSNYRFDVKVQNFPKLCFDCNDYEKSLVHDFVNNILFYTKQESENKVEAKLKKEIAGMQYATKKSTFQIKSDAIFLSYHNEIQKWWLRQHNAEYLTKTCKFFQTATQHYIANPLLAVANAVNRNRMIKSGITFLPEYVNSLNSIESTSTPVLILSEVIALSVIKLTQYIQDHDFILLDLNYILNLPTNDSILLDVEIGNCEEKIFILTCDNITHVSNSEIKDILQRLDGQRLILVTSKELAEGISKCFKHTAITDNICLNHLTQESQKKMLANTTVVFQGEPVSLDLLLDDDSKVFIRGEHINKMINEDTIVLGQLLTNSNYEEIKDFYVSRKVIKQCGCGAWHDNVYGTCVEQTFFINRITCYKETLYDIDDRIVLVTAEPGMGKSSLLTHLSLKTKKRDPTVWILRIDLLDYSKYFYQWKNNKVEIGILEALTLICTVLVNCESNYFFSNWRIILINEEGVIVLDDLTALSESQMFEINMFLHYYNTHKIIFLFDGFDEICPDYEEVVTRFLNVVKDSDNQQHRIWITSRAYDEILTSLRTEFGEPYSLQPFSFEDQEMYIEKFLQTKLNLKEAHSEVINKIVAFILFMKKIAHWLHTDARQDMNDDISRDLFEELNYSINQTQLMIVYLEAARYLKNEIGRIPHLAGKYENLQECKFDNELYAQELVLADHNKYEFITVPLHLFMIIDYLQNQINDTTICTKWDPTNFNMLVLYERCIDVKLQTIRFEDKNRMDVYRPDVQFMFEKERKEFVNKHKKLAAYAMFFSSIHKLFSETELDYVRETIEWIKRGEERTGFITNIINDLPRFLHMTFAEYFAAKYISGMLITKQSDDKTRSLWHFILYDMMFRDNKGIMNIFDTMLHADKELKKVIYRDDNRKIIFDILMNGHPPKNLSLGCEDKPFSSLTEAVNSQLYSWTSLFLSTFDFVNADNIDDVVDKIAESEVLTVTAINNEAGILGIILSKMRSVDEIKLHRLFESYDIDCSGTDEEIIANFFDFLMP